MKYRIVTTDPRHWKKLKFEVQILSMGQWKLFDRVETLAEGEALIKSCQSPAFVPEVIKEYEV